MRYYPIVRYCYIPNKQCKILILVQLDVVSVFVYFIINCTPNETKINSHK